MQADRFQSPAHQHKGDADLRRLLGRGYTAPHLLLELPAHGVQFAVDEVKAPRPAGVAADEGLDAVAEHALSHLRHGRDNVRGGAGGELLSGTGPDLL